MVQLCRFLTWVFETIVTDRSMFSSIDAARRFGSSEDHNLRNIPFFQHISLLYMVMGTVQEGLCILGSFHSGTSHIWLLFEQLYGAFDILVWAYRGSSFSARKQFFARFSGRGRLLFFFEIFLGSA